MNAKHLPWLIAAVVVAALLVAWLGHEYRNEAVAFLRSLRRAL
jgi:hypothetical protein